MVVNLLPMRMLTSFLADEIFPPRYMSCPTYLKGMSFNEDIATS